MSDDPRHAPGLDRDRRQRLLDGISGLLGCAIEDLTSTVATSQLAETAELLRLWDKVADAMTRRAVIEHLRRAAGEP